MVRLPYNLKYTEMNQMSKFVTAPQPTMKRRADMDGPDFYPTPAWATHALVEHEAFKGDIWECACGDGAMSEVLALQNNNVYSSDLYKRGFGDSGIDFTKTNKKFTNIITNPPFHSAEEFVASGLQSASKKFALLLRLAFLEGGRRQKEIFSTHPPARVWVFSERITFYPKGAPQAGTGTVAYAWFVWDKDAPNSTTLKWLPPGLKAKYAVSHKTRRLVRDRHP